MHLIPWVIDLYERQARRKSCWAFNMLSNVVRLSPLHPDKYCCGLHTVCFCELCAQRSTHNTRCREEIWHDAICLTFHLLMFTLRILSAAVEYVSPPSAPEEEHGHVPQRLGLGLGRHGTTTLFLRDGPCGRREVSFHLLYPRTRCNPPVLHIHIPHLTRWKSVLMLSARVSFIHLRHLAPSVCPIRLHRTLVPRHENGDAHLDDEVTLKQTWKAVSRSGLMNARSQAVYTPSNSVECLGINVIEHLRGTDGSPTLRMPVHRSVPVLVFKPRYRC